VIILKFVSGIVLCLSSISNPSECDVIFLQDEDGCLLGCSAV
jgi:hypothetical protein